jgi:hypothetical protein
MVFRVDLDHFPTAAEQMTGGKSVAVTSREGRTIASAANPSQNLVVVAISGKPPADVRAHLQSAGLTVLNGEWLDAAEVPLMECEEPPAFIAAVAYRSRESMPGLWVDAFPFEPTQAEVLKELYHEFSTSGELDGEVTFEEFVRLANPNVLILTPHDVIRYVRSKPEP